MEINGINLEELLTADCKEAVKTGNAVIIHKNNAWCVLDKSEETLFEVLPFVNTRFGFCIVIPTKTGKTYYTHLGEIVKRKKGKVSFLNRCVYDLRKDNIQISEWQKS